MLKFFVFFLFLFVGHITADVGIPLSGIKALTLYKGQYANRQRSTQLQLQCQGGSAGCQHIPDVIQCTNVGYDGIKDSWKCEAKLPNGVNLGSIEVVCEGYGYPGDHLVRVGSCVLQFTLEGHTPITTYDNSNIFTGFIVVILLTFLICLCLISSSSRSRTVSNRSIIIHPTPTVVHTGATIIDTTPAVIHTGSTYYRQPPSTTIATGTGTGTGTDVGSNFTQKSTGYGTSKSE